MNDHDDHLSILKLYYSGRMTLDQLSLAHECDAAALIAAHESLPKDQRVARMVKAYSLKGVILGNALPDDPMFGGGVEFFSYRRPQRNQTINRGE